MAGDAVSMGVRAGGAFELAEAGSAGLRSALEGATGRAVSVSVAARRDPVNVYG